MNRAERRRQERQRRHTGHSQDAQNVPVIFAEAVAHHKGRQFAQAEKLYHHILTIIPDHADVHHLLGLSAYQQGEYASAIEWIQRAIRLDPHKPHFPFNLGLALEKQGRWEEAIDAYQRALTIQPQYTDARNNLGNLLREQRRFDEAVEAFTGILRDHPNSADAHNNLGVTLKEKRELERAIQHYRAALRLNPSHAEAHNNLGVALMEQGQVEEALRAFQQAVFHRPGYAHAHYHMGLAHLWRDQVEEALACFCRSAELLHNHEGPVHIRTLSTSRIKHDHEQIEHLQTHRGVTGIPSSYVETLRSLYARAQREEPPARWLEPSSQERRLLAPSFNRIVHWAPAESIPEGALNPQLDVPAIEARYRSGYPEIMYVDQLLNENALASIRRFCLDSTIWKRDYQNGYIGTFLAEGFACPLLLQIAEELRTRFPGIFGEHRLVQAWAFKYDSSLRGLNLHADASAVNVNFWITPDEANLDPQTGGLVVWDKEAPDEWDFKMFNNDRNQSMIREFLDRHHARPVRIPYRQNRAIIFNSNLFHETDTLAFRDEYEYRRINITLLYGYRQKRRVQPRA